MYRWNKELKICFVSRSNSFYRHSQMNTRIFEAFNSREQQVNDYMAGCAMKFGMDCTCGPTCRCKNCPVHSAGGGTAEMDTSGPSLDEGMAAPMNLGAFAEPRLQIDQQMQFSDFPVAQAPAPTGIAAPNLPFNVTDSETNAQSRLNNHISPPFGITTGWSVSWRRRRGDLHPIFCNELEKISRRFS